MTLCLNRNSAIRKFNNSFLVIVLLSKYLHSLVNVVIYHAIILQQKMGIPSYVGVQLCVEGCAIRRLAGGGSCNGVNSSRSSKGEWTRAQTPKLSRQELSLKGTKFRTKIPTMGYQEASN